MSGGRQIQVIIWPGMAGESQVRNPLRVSPNTESTERWGCVFTDPFYRADGGGVFSGGGGGWW